MSRKPSTTQSRKTAPWAMMADSEEPILFRKSRNSLFNPGSSESEVSARAKLAHLNDCFGDVRREVATNALHLQTIAAPAKAANAIVRTVPRSRYRHLP
ncbi:MAG: hypothetical protein R3D97_07910 [Paracoccaceae bacterium]